jgi:hypothetical protein
MLITGQRAETLGQIETMVGETLASSFSFAIRELSNKELFKCRNFTFAPLSFSC